MDKPKVLHTYKVFVPDIDGGIPAAIKTLCMGTQDRFGNRVLVARSQGGSRRYTTIEGIDVEAVPSLGNALSMPIAPSYPCRYLDLAASSCLVVHHAPFPLADAVVPLLSSNLPLIVYWHADVTSFPVLRKVVAPAMRWTLRRADRIVVSDASIIRSSKLLHPFAGKCQVIPYGVDLTFWSSCSEEERFAADKLRQRHPRMVLAIARLVPYKGLDVLLQALVGIDAEAVIIGEGPLLGRLQKRAKQLGVAERVLFKGRLEASEVKAHLYAAGVFAFPSVTTAEAFGIVQLEAMATGLPIVNTSLPTAVPVVARDQQEALTVSPNEPAKLAAALGAILDDKSLATRLGNNGRSRALSEYSQSTYAARMEAVYADVLGRSVGAG